VPLRVAVAIVEEEIAGSGCLPRFQVGVSSHEKEDGYPYIASACDTFQRGGFMNILAAIKSEEKKVKKQLAKLQNQLSGLEAAATALGRSTNHERSSVKKRVLSAAGRAAISKAAKKRWAKVRKQAKKAAS
jgi:hypothetical protein